MLVKAVFGTFAYPTWLRKTLLPLNVYYLTLFYLYLYIYFSIFDQGALEESHINTIHLFSSQNMG